MPVFLQKRAVCRQDRIKALFPSPSDKMRKRGVKHRLAEQMEIQKFDLHTIQMALNMISFLLINYIVFDYSGYSITLHLDPVNFKPSYTVDYGTYSIVLNGLLIIIAAYICIYCLLEYIKFVKFEKQEIKSDRDFK